MTYRTLGNDYTADVEEARARVYDATVAYQKGTGSVDAVNKANRALADTHSRWRNYYGGRIAVRADEYGCDRPRLMAEDGEITRADAKQLEMMHEE